MKGQIILEDEEVATFGAMPPAPSRKIVRGKDPGVAAVVAAVAGAVPHDVAVAVV